MENYDAELELIYNAINDLKTLKELKSLFNTIVRGLENDETIIELIKSIQDNLLKEQGLNIWGRGNGNLGAFLSFLKIKQHEIQLKRKKQFSNDKNQLKTNLEDPQQGKLFDLLVEYGFIANKNKESFIWAFGGEQPQPADWQPIEWIDKSIRRHEANMQTLYELLFLLGVKNDTEVSSPDNIYRKIEYCFKSMKNISVKNPHEITQKTSRHKLLKTIVEKIKEHS
jgi:hypothetical protein